MLQNAELPRKIKKSKKDWLYNIGDTVYLKGTKSVGLSMIEVLKHLWPPDIQINGIVSQWLNGEENILPTDGDPGYSVEISPQYKYLFYYGFISLAEKDIFTLNKYNEFNLSEELFEI